MGVEKEIDMKCISIKQPWASLILEGIKPVENRTRPWNHKGPVAIHTGKTFDYEGFTSVIRGCSDNVYQIAYDSQELIGGIIGSVKMIDCVKDHDSDYFFGPYGYVFENPKKIDLIPWKGQQGIMNIPFCPHCFQNYELHGPCPCIGEDCI